MKIERCPKEEYENFWSNWNRVTDKQIIDIIFQKAVDLFKMDARRKKGQFYTPTNLAKHGWAYLEKELSENFWLDGTWRIWDCCCGEGGLAINVIPRSALQYTYLSSLDAGEIDFVKPHLPMCKKIWQMDFLNTQINNFPDEVKRDMENPDIRWLFFINPPYGEGSSGKATDDTEWHKKDVSKSLVKAEMKYHNMSVESKEKYAQFFFRIEKEFKGRYVLGSYTTMKAFVSKEYANLRKFWRPVFKSGLICCANKWHQGNGAFPSVFSVFDCREKGKWETMLYDILEYKKSSPFGVFKGKKSFVQEDTKRSFRKYFFSNEKLPNDELTVVQSNGLKTFSGKEKTNNYRPKGTLASAYFGSAFLRRQDFSWMVSGAYISHNCFINKRNYKQILCGMGLFWSVKHTWLNHEQCLSAPSRSLTPQEQSDSILYALMCCRNRTTTARLEEAIITTNKGRVINGGIIVENKLNPFDKKMFDWNCCSEAGQEVLQLYKHYLDNVVKWKEQDTVIGKGEWLGLYQYHRIIPLPKELVAAIEKLREHVEKTALALCLS
jgi:predicted RNA methylase